MAGSSSASTTWTRPAPSSSAGRTLSDHPAAKAEITTTWSSTLRRWMSDPRSLDPRSRPRRDQSALLTDRLSCALDVVETRMGLPRPASAVLLTAASAQDTIPTSYITAPPCACRQEPAVSAASGSRNCQAQSRGLRRSPDERPQERDWPPVGISQSTDSLSAGCFLPSP